MFLGKDLYISGWYKLYSKDNLSSSRIQVGNLHKDCPYNLEGTSKILHHFVLYTQHLLHMEKVSMVANVPEQQLVMARYIEWMDLLCNLGCKHSWGCDSLLYIRRYLHMFLGKGPCIFGWCMLDFADIQSCWYIRVCNLEEPPRNSLGKNMMGNLPTLYIERMGRMVMADRGLLELPLQLPLKKYFEG